MKIENGKIVSVTEDELIRLYIRREMYDAMSFEEYKDRMKRAGCEVEE